MPTHASLPGFNVTGMEHPTVAVPIPTHFDPETFDIAETPDMAFKMDFFHGPFSFAYSVSTSTSGNDVTVASLTKHLPKPYNLIRSARRTTAHCEVYVRTRKHGIHLRSRNNRLYIQVLGHDERMTIELANKLVAHYFAPTHKGPDRVDYGLWINTEFGSDHETMVPRPWRDNIQNYSRDVQTQLGKLMATTSLPEHGGRVVLFHGQPGTGKTWALRSLMTEWQEWARFEFILDVERFFNDVAYASNLLKSSSSRQRILVLEDADAYVARSTHRHAGMARLLNLADGILSESQKSAFFFTTNATPDELDAALTRPGRCLAAIKFGPLSVDEANKQFDGTSYRTTSPMTIAEIFAQRGVAPRIATAGSTAPTGTYL